MEKSEERILKLYFKEDSEEYREAVRRLSEHIPLAYIVGEQAFYGEIYRVTEDTLIPRPDTEHVVEHIIKRIKKGGALLDLCTGSGCIAISTLCHTIDTTAVMVDISEGATQVALENAKINRVGDRCNVICADIKELTFDGFQFDIIASNPPYVKTEVVATLEKECSFEPYIAFDGGCDGMDFYKLILERFSVYLKEDGFFIFEIGYDQSGDIVKVCRDYGFCCDVFKDYGKNDRVAVCYR